MLKPVLTCSKHSIAADIDKVEVKHQNVQTKSPEMKDQNTWTEIVKDEEMQAENTAQQQGILTVSVVVWVHNTFSSMHE